MTRALVEHEPPLPPHRLHGGVRGVQALDKHPANGVLVSKRTAVSFVAMFAAITLAAPLHAQTRSTIDPTALDAAVSTRPDANRSRIASALSSDAGRAAASNMGVTQEALATRIAALDDASAKKVADQILAGGDGTVVISTTAIIIGLLLIILLTR